MFFTRLVSGIVLVVIAIVLMVLGGNILLAALGVISLIGLFELYRTVKIEKSVLGAAGYLLAAAYYIYVWLNPYGDQIPFAFIIGGLMIILAIYVFAFPEFSFEQMVMTFFGVIYVPVMLSYIYKTWMLDGGFLVWLIFLASWGCDTCAYCVGMLIGKHKMTPKLSPKKSVEGAVGGILGAMILGFVYGSVLGGSMTLTSPGVECSIICGVGAVISQIGDLAASAIKRNHNIKDYGKLIPGHGGIMDRFDSVIFVAPAIYFTAMCLLAAGTGSFVWW